MSTLSLSPVSAGLYAALNVVGLTGLLGTSGGPHDTAVKQGASFPVCWFTAAEEQARGFGTGGLRKVYVTVHAASVGSAAKGPAKELQGILGEVVVLLEDATLTVSGYTKPCGKVFYNGTTDPVESEIGGQACWEAVANFYLWVEP